MSTMELYGSLWNLQHLCVYYATYEIWPFLWPKSGFADVVKILSESDLNMMFTDLRDPSRNTSSVQFKVICDP